MILYDPSTGDPRTTPFIVRPRTCFVMTRLGQSAPGVIGEIRQCVGHILADYSFQLVDASSQTTGRDFLHKIWQLIISVPVGLAIVYEQMPASTMGNVFYELGLMQAAGKNTLVIKYGNVDMPSDFLRTEYVEYDRNFDDKVHQYVSYLLSQAEYFETMADSLRSEPILAIDYFRRAYLLTEDQSILDKITDIVDSAELTENSIELVSLPGLRTERPMGPFM